METTKNNALQIINATNYYGTWQGKCNSYAVYWVPVLCQELSWIITGAITGSCSVEALVHPLYRCRNKGSQLLSEITYPACITSQELGIYRVTQPPPPSSFQIFYHSRMFSHAHVLFLLSCTVPGTIDKFSVTTYLPSLNISCNMLSFTSGLFCFA